MKSRQSAKTHPPPLEPVKTLSEGITIHRFQTVSKLTPPLPLARNFSLQIEVTAIMTNDTSARLLTSLGPPAKYVFIDAHHPTPEGMHGQTFLLPLLRTSCGINNQFSFRRKSEPSVSLEPRTGYSSGRGGEIRRIFLIGQLADVSCAGHRKKITNGTNRAVLGRRQTFPAPTNSRIVGTNRPS